MQGSERKRPRGSGASFGYVFYLVSRNSSVVIFFFAPKVYPRQHIRSNTLEMCHYPYIILSAKKTKDTRLINLLESKLVSTSSYQRHGS